MIRLRPLILGAAMGAALSAIGFSSWDEVNKMFCFADFRLLLTFGGGVILTALVLLGARRLGADLPARPIHRGTILGGVVFGAGWALSGACPSIAFVQLGEGQLLALVTLAGIALGNWAHGAGRRRLDLPSAPSCAD